MQADVSIAICQSLNILIRVCVCVCVCVSVVYDLIAGQVKVHRLSDRLNQWQAVSTLPQGLWEAWIFKPTEAHTHTHTYTHTQSDLLQHAGSADKWLSLLDCTYVTVCVCVCVCLYSFTRSYTLRRVWSMDFFFPLRPHIFFIVYSHIFCAAPKTAEEGFLSCVWYQILKFTNIDFARHSC